MNLNLTDRVGSLPILNLKGTELRTFYLTNKQNNGDKLDDIN